MVGVWRYDTYIYLHVSNNGINQNIIYWDTGLAVGLLGAKLLPEPMLSFCQSSP